jgi:hypothetical protein
MNANSFGILMACAEAGVSPQSYETVAGMTKCASADWAPAGRLVIKAAKDAMEATGYGRTAPCIHLRLLCKEAADWSTHHDDVFLHVIRTVKVLEPLCKQAFSDVMSGLGTAGRLGMYLPAGVGAGLGSLYWLLSRHANQDSADTESMAHQRTTTGS